MIVNGSNILFIFNELFHKWTYLQNRIVTDIENTLMVTKGKRGGGVELGDWDWHIYITKYKIDN